MKNAVLLSALLSISAMTLWAGTTGKIAGRIRSTETGEAVVGASVMVEGTTLGASTDVEGYYTINNIPPGTYSIVASGVGYQKKRVVNVKVTVDFTTSLDIRLSTDVIALETVEVQAEAPMVRRDLTSSQTNVNAEQISTLPVESVAGVLSLQAGVTQGAGGELHIRGGRSNEIQYTINGVNIINPYDNTKSVEIATNAVEELSVVSGTFNAEYGNALSGIVNTVTKEGGAQYRGSISFTMGDYVSTNTSLFPSIDKVDALNNQTIEATLGGPIIPDGGNDLTFFLSTRYDYYKGWLYGIREHTPDDFVSKNPMDPNDIQVVSSGDSSRVAMNPSRALSATGKLTYAPISTLKLKYDILYSNGYSQSYQHDWKYNPDGRTRGYEWGLVNALELRHALNATTYYTLRGSWILNDYKSFLYPLLDEAGNPVNYHAGSNIDITKLHADPRYQPDYKLTPAANYTFLAGGTQGGHFYQRTQTFGGKFDITSQLSRSHEVKAGAEYQAHTLMTESFSVLCDTVRYVIPTIPGTQTVYHDVYEKTPKQLSAYVQDKMEFESLILNLGLRYDYFYADSRYSTDIYNPSPVNPSLPSTVDTASLLAPAPAKQMWSPRIGVSFPITDKGIIHFSYGHFYQMPTFSNLYTNPGFKYGYSSGAPTFGNANLNPELTVSYELGLQQQLFENVAINITGFYKDVRDLLALQQIRISATETYYTYVNKDYANIKGITFNLTKRRTADDLLSLTLDYTLQTAEGNETSANAFFLDLSSGRQSEKVPVYLTWDQTHTLNATIGVGRPNDWTVTVVGRLSSGLPYTPQITSTQVYLTPNSGRKPASYRVDLLADKSFDLFGANLVIFLKVYNLFDTANERYVYDDTGRATYTLLEKQGSAQDTNRLAGEVPGVHSASEYFVVPTYYSSPREIKVGLSLEF
jgi:outer membrane receptor protein involved in Fe transport